MVCTFSRKFNTTRLTSLVGLYGMKPTTLRLPVGGWTATMAGAEQIVPTIGPLSTSLEGCKLFIKTIIDAKPWYTEPAILPFPWKEEDAFKGKRLKIAVLWDDGVVKPHPPVTRALKQVVDKLKEKINVEVIEWKPYRHDLAWELIVHTNAIYLFKLQMLMWRYYCRQISTSPTEAPKNSTPAPNPTNPSGP
jgi:Asp-tRNA(Asn)/Glu-tRNA(Gln) amidotransferase A subunit family amidase